MLPVLFSVLKCVNIKKLVKIDVVTVFGWNYNSPTICVRDVHSVYCACLS